VLDSFECERACGGENACPIFFTVWKHGSKSKHLFNREIFEQKLQYTHMNPVKAGLVRLSQDYLYSSAGNYAGRDDNVMDVTIANW